MSQLLDAARAAVEAGAWADAVEALELRAQAAYGNGDFEAAITAWESLHGHHATHGDATEAARTAAMLAMYLMMDTGLMSPVRG